MNKDSMEVFYKFKSAKDYVSLPIDWHYTNASDVIKYVLEKKCSGKRKKANYDNLFLTNVDTDQEYLDGNTLIPKGTFLVIRRAPRVSCMPILVNPPAESKWEEDDVCANEDSFDVPSTSLYPTDSEWVQFWHDLSPSTVIAPARAALPSKADEDRKIRDLIDASALDSRQSHNFTDSFGGGKGFGRGGMGGRSGGRGFGQGGLSNQITPPPGYICHRCKVPGHFIQHCPTNGDPAFDVKRIKPPTGIPSSMLMASPDGSYALPGGVVAELKPNEAAFEKIIQGIPSTRSVTKLPAELYCPVCRSVMKDAVLASKCCFKSFCDKCIRNYIMSKSLCVCGALNVLADDLLPNKTLRDTIVRYLESTNSSGANGGSYYQPQDMESSPCAKPKIPCSKMASPMLSAPSKGVVLAPKSEGNTKAEEMTKPVEADNVAHETSGKATVEKGVEVSKVSEERAKEPWPQMCPLTTDEEMQQKPISGEVQQKKQKFADMQPRPHQDFANMPVESCSYNPYWNCMQPEFSGFGRPYCGQLPFMGYGLGPTSISLGAAFHHSSFGAQVYMSIPSQRNLSKIGTGSNDAYGPPVMCTGEFDALETTKKQKQDHEKSRGSMKVSRDRDFNRSMIVKEDVKSDLKLSPECSTHDTELTHTSFKRKVKHYDDYYKENHSQPLNNVSFKSSTEATTSDWKHKASVLARIAFPEVESPVFKKRKLGNFSPSSVNRSSHNRSHSTTSNGIHEDQWKTAAAVSKNSYDYADDHICVSSDDDKHFKRRPSRYESSPAPAVVKGRHSSRSWREKGITAATVSRLSVY